MTRQPGHNIFVLCLVGMIALLIAGCADKSHLWRLYGTAQYAYGRMEALGEVHCQAPIPKDRIDACREAARIQQLVYQMKPVIDAELSKSDPDWDKLLPYVDLLLGAAGKAMLVP